MHPTLVTIYFSANEMNVSPRLRRVKGLRRTQSVSWTVCQFSYSALGFVLAMGLKEGKIWLTTNNSFLKKMHLWLWSHQGSLINPTHKCIKVHKPQAVCERRFNSLCINVTTYMFLMKIASSFKYIYLWISITDIYSTCNQQLECKWARVSLTANFHLLSPARFLRGNLKSKELNTCITEIKNYVGDSGDTETHEKMDSQQWKA